ncbi:MAG TPA: hypothetical protein VNW97_20530 [Candidatus Saccharimonadales bacterium]|nr:hypothetical protein [Candidatus Saccharimonadales bacterium]
MRIKIPWIGEVEWGEDPTERNAAWRLYIELVTRIAVQPLAADQGLLREALSSLHELFAATRETLKQAGPDVGASTGSVGGIAIAVLNRGLRPFLAKWHSRLADWEPQRDPRTGAGHHERQWAEYSQMRAELEALRVNLELYAQVLATIAGVTIQVNN